MTKTAVRVYKGQQFVEEDEDEGLWSSRCAVCGGAYEVFVEDPAHAFWPSLKCEGHRRASPGGRKDGVAAWKRRALAAEKRIEDLERALARYELTPGEASVFGERCAAATKERRAKVKKLRAMRAPAPSPFG